MSTLWIPYHIVRGYVQMHPELIFVYSNDYMGKGCEGMAWHFIGEPNAFMVPTMKKMCQSATDKFWRDEQPWIEEVVMEAISKIPRDGRPIIPVCKMGMGCSRMYEIAPKLFKRMWDEIHNIQHKEITWTS